MPTYQELYYQEDIDKYYLHLDSLLREFPGGIQSVQNLYSNNVQQSEMNRFPNAEARPYNVGHPLSENIQLCTLPGTDIIYLIDVFPWQSSDTINLRRICNQTQANKFNFQVQPSIWHENYNMAVPLAIDQGENWHYQTFISGYHICYNHICHPENPINPFFASWLDNKFSKAHLKQLIIQTQREVDRINGERPPATPVIAPAGSDQKYAQFSATVTCATPDATIYIQQGSEPAIANANIYHTQIPINLQQNADTLYAVAEYYDYIGSSQVALANYNYDPDNVATPTFTPATNTENQQELQVTINHQDGSTVYYTTNGDTPTRDSEIYRGPIPLNLTNSAVTLKAFAVDNDSDGESVELSQIYQYVPSRVQPPIIQPENPQHPYTIFGPYLDSSITGKQTNDFLYYGFTANPEPNTPYNDGVMINLTNTDAQGVTLYARATDTTGSEQSEIVSQQYVSCINWKHAWLLEDNGDDLSETNTLDLNSISNAPVYKFDQPGGVKAASFNGINNFLLANTQQQINSGIFTMAAWIKPRSLPSASNTYTCWVFEPSADGLADKNGPSLAILPTGQLQCTTREINDQAITLNAGLVKTNQWNHVVVVASQSSLSLYLNGQIQGNVPSNGTLKAANARLLALGQERFQSEMVNSFYGYLRNLYYTDKAITADEIQSLFTEEKHAFTG